MSPPWTLIAVSGAAFVFYRIWRDALLSRNTKKTAESDAASRAAITHPVDSILDSLPLGVVVFDKSGEEQFRNSMARLTSNVRHESVLIDATIDRLFRQVSAGRAVTEQMELVGPPFRVLVLTAAPSDAHEVVVTIEDITERWRLDQVRTDFVANVSHELRTPVGAMAVLAETLEQEVDDEDLKNLVRRVVLESHRMGQTIDDLLELSRIQLGGEMEIAPVDVSEVCFDVVERLRPVAGKRSITIELTVSSGDSVVSGDRFQFVSAISNLIDNAIKYSDEGGIVRVNVMPADAAVAVEVVDEGIGIPVASIDRIFERFYRVDRARSRGTGGTGLGLSIVRHVATNHGGEVNVRSREGEGSTFTLRLPRVKPSDSGTIEGDDDNPVTKEPGHADDSE